MHPMQTHKQLKTATPPRITAAWTWNARRSKNMPLSSSSSSPSVGTAVGAAVAVGMGDGAIVGAWDGGGDAVGAAEVVGATVHEPGASGGSLPQSESSTTVASSSRQTGASQPAGPAYQW